MYSIRGNRVIEKVKVNRDPLSQKLVWNETPSLTTSVSTNWSSGQVWESVSG